MFKQVRYVQNSFSITFQRYQTIRRKSNEFEDFLKERFEGHYGLPQVISIPDELDPEVPRLIFGSKHGFSQIIISQIGITLNALYSPDWQTDITKGKQYLMDRLEALFSLLEMLDHMPVYFCGLTTRVQFPTDAEEATILSRLQEYFCLKQANGNTHDIQVKMTSIYNERFYSNITVQNYRTWKITLSGVPRLSRRKAVERGLEILGDFNDRYAFNEQDDYLSSSNVAHQIIDEGLTQISNTIHKILELSP